MANTKQIAFSENINPSSIDYENGIISGVKEANKGLNLNGYYFNDQLLQDLADAGNSGNGIKCRFGHPNEFSESLGTYVGRKVNYRVSNDALFCDLHLDPITKETKVNGTSTWNYILKMADTNPDMFGNSVVFMPASVDILEIDGREYPVPTLEEFRASDLVDEPAATTHLFNSEKNIKMSNKITAFFDGLKLQFSEALDKLNEKPEELENEVTDTLTTGQMVTIETDETDVPKEGDAVTLEDGSPAPDGEHTTESGLVITTVDGVISSIAEEVTEDVPEETIEEQFKSLNKDFLEFKESTKEFMQLSADSFSKALEAVNEDSKAKEIAFAEMKEKYEASEAKYKVLASSIESSKLEKFEKETLPEPNGDSVDAWLKSKKTKN